MDAVGLFRNFDQTLLRRLVDGLSDASALAAYASAQILTSIARSEKTRPEQRRFILRALTEAVADPASRRAVHSWYVEGGCPASPSPTTCSTTRC